MISYTLVTENTGTPEDSSISLCSCHISDSQWDCNESFSTTKDLGETCYEQYGGAYRLFERGAYNHPVEVVTIENNTIGIGTAAPEAPLHILSSGGENGYEIYLEDTKPQIVLNDLDDSTQIVISADKGQLDISSPLNAPGLSKELRQYIIDTIYPVGSLYSSFTISSADKVETLLGGTWEMLNEGRVLWSTQSGDAGTQIEAGLPNIKGFLSNMDYQHVMDPISNGAFTKTKISQKMWNPDGQVDDDIATINFDASKGTISAAKNIYRDDVTTVQPPAIKVYMYRRTK